MVPSPIFRKPCPNFPSSFQLNDSSDLLRSIDPDIGITLFFLDTQLKTGHYTMMWSMSKVMWKIARNIGSEGEGEGLKLWERVLKDRNEGSLRMLMEVLDRM